MNVPARISLFVCQRLLAASVTKCRIRYLMIVKPTSNNVDGIYHGSFQVVYENLAEVIQACRGLHGEIPL
jgi:hypothetical protein